MICEFCQQNFTSVRKNQKICSAICKDKIRIQRINGNWMKKEKDTESRSDTNEILCRSHVAKRFSAPFKKFNACRG